MDAKTRKSLRAVIDYLERDEGRFWAECEFDADAIYVHVARLAVWLDNENASPKELQKALDQHLDMMRAFQECWTQ